MFQLIGRWGVLARDVLHEDGAAQDYLRVQADLASIDKGGSSWNPGSLQSKPRSALAGSYGHPVHPILVTVPIGAWVCSLVFDVISYFSAEPRAWSVGAMWLTPLRCGGCRIRRDLGRYRLPEPAARHQRLQHWTAPRGAQLDCVGDLHRRLHLALHHAG